MEQFSPIVRVDDQEALAMIRQLATEDMRSIGNEIAWLIKSEFAHRYSTPQPVITVEEAQRSGGSNG